MGRYYRGDIEGKFWFAVQSSDDADYFGGVCNEDEDEELLEYSFNTDDLPAINEGVDRCLEILGDKKEIIDSYFAPGGDGVDSYSPDHLAQKLGFEKERDPECMKIMENYARLILGMKIKECVERTGQCVFDAEI